MSEAKKLPLTKFEDLNEFAAKLKNDGYDIISAFKEGSTFNSYFYFHKHGLFGYCQKERFEGFALSTENKPCKNFGTGHGFLKGWETLTLENAVDTLAFSKRIIDEEREVKNYESVEEFILLKHGTTGLF